VPIGRAAICCDFLHTAHLKGVPVMTGTVQASEPGSSPPGGPPPAGPENGWRKDYWRKNLRLMVILLAIWFIVSFGCSILFVEQLNKVVINGFPLGFWFAQQGSIYTFIILILVYALRMDRLDDQYGVSERDSEGNRL
jgi:putative solute:sodium symporter small subunit